MTPLDLFVPRNQNMIQRVGFAVMLIGVIVAVVLHNPLDGYTFEDHRTGGTIQDIPNACTGDEYSEARILRDTSNLEFESFVKFFGRPENSTLWTAEQRVLFSGPENSDLWTKEQHLEFRNSRNARLQLLSEKCLRMVPFSWDVTLPVSEWRSNAPLIPWLGSVIHLVGVVLSILASLAIWLTIFRDTHNESRK